MVKVKRIYGATSKEDGRRVLVDRLWPRGISKDRAALDEWAKDVAPSPELRIWFGHDPARFSEFRHRYLIELADNEAAAVMKKQNGAVTLLYAAKDPIHNHAVVLKEFLDR